MPILQLSSRIELNSNLKLKASYERLSELLELLNTHKIPHATEEVINKNVVALNSIVVTDKAFAKELIKTRVQILKIIKKDCKLVTINHYRNLWMVLSMSVFGLPIGVMLGISSKNMAFLAIGLPIGMALGIAFGSAMDKKAKEEGRQLPVNMNR